MTLRTDTPTPHRLPHTPGESLVASGTLGRRRRTHRTARYLALVGWVGALATFGCSTTPAPQLEPRLEVYSQTDEEGVTRYTIRRVLRPRANDEVGEPTQSEVPSVPQSGLSAPDPSTAVALRREARDAGAPSLLDAPPAAVEAQGAAPEAEVVPGSIADIQRQIDRDREALREIVSEGGLKAIEQRKDPRLEQIAERLPRLQAELEALEKAQSP